MYINYNIYDIIIVGGYMYNKAIEVLNIFDKHGYLAYIVGGYPRDMLLNIKTNDIDICTNATPKEIVDIFETENVSDYGYGSVKIIYKKYRFDVTTFRKDIKYENNRKPVKIKYIMDLKKDLLRRDFTINTLCIDKDENLLDLLSCKQDIDLRIIKTVGNPRYRIKEDSLRILRAIRFAGTLNFSIDEKTMNYIKKYGYLLKKLSYSRKMDELKKIFSSKNKEKSRELIISLGIDKYLEIDNLADIVLCDDIMGIWSQLKMSSKYPFSKVEKSMINNIKKMLLSDLDSYTVYKYGLYVSTVVGSIKGIDYKKINDIYYDLPIYSRKDINIKGTDISYCLNREPGNYIGKIIDDIERLIVMKKLENEKEKIICYVKNNY